MNQFKKTILFIVSICLLISVVQALDSYNLEYDANGNLIYREDLNVSYQYNSFNQLWKVWEGEVESGVLLLEYTHHPLEERVYSKKEFNRSGDVVQTTYYPWKELVRVVNASGEYDYVVVYHENTLVAVLNPDGSKHFFLTDHLGTITTVTDENGDVIEDYAYTPFGVILGDLAVTSRHTFSAKEFDSRAQLYDFHARQYAPDLGRFTQPDTLLPNVYDPQQLNRYSYVGNNPYRFTDSTGHYIDTAADIVSIGLDLNDIQNDPTDPVNYIALGADTVAAFVPFATGAGRGVKLADRAIEGLRSADRSVDANQATTQILKKLPTHTRNRFEKAAREGFESKDVFKAKAELHAQDFGLTKQQYEKAARDFANYRGGGLQYYTRNNGQIVKFNENTQEFMVLSKEGRIANYYKAKDGLRYYQKDVASHNPYNNYRLKSRVRYKQPR